jgi:cyanate lyase
MTKPMISFTHGLPGDADYVSELREMTDEEYAHFQVLQEQSATLDAARAATIAAAQAKADAARAVLEKLGITEDVLNVLHGAISNAPSA